MTVRQQTGAPKAGGDVWQAIDWQQASSHVKRLQMRIAKAIKEQRHGKAKALQWVLTHSYSAKLLAVKRVTSSSGGKTAGIDGVVLKSPKQKIEAVKALKRRGYQAQPLRRIYIPKKNGKQRPLGIPTILDRAQQALHLLSLEPIAEMMADRNSYGFRPHRSCADAIEQCFRALAKKTSAQWILEGDIKACFDKISHSWLMAHIPMDKQVLKQWLGVGFVHKHQWYMTNEGTPQGGVASPTLANMALDGLERLVQSISSQSDKVNFVRYADDFIITGNSKELVEGKIKPAIETFLAERGLTLSNGKTKITHIAEGFDFLGFNVRKYKGKLLIKPSKKSVKSFLADIQETIRRHASSTTLNLLRQLNPKLRGWANYYKHVVAKETFDYVDHSVFLAIWRWCKHRHPNKCSRWRKKKYFCRNDTRDWIFHAKFRRPNGERKRFSLFEMGYVPIKRHVKIRASANPYDSNYNAYFEQRTTQKKQQQFGVKVFDGYSFA